jgi:hypothetical protein
MVNKSELKKLIYTACVEAAQERVHFCRAVMNDAQAAANAEEKSSVGDKYETARAMAQIERDKAAMQLAEALKTCEALQKIDADCVHQKIEWGSLIETDRGWYFLAVPLGRIHLSGVDCMAISTMSPIGKLLLGKMKGNQISLNGQPISISAVY